MATNESSLDEIVSALMRALRGMEGYADCVHRGQYPLVPPRTPWAALGAASVASRQGPVMGQYTRTATFDVEVWGQAPSLERDARVVASEALLDRLVTALDLERESTSSALFRCNTFVVSSVVPEDYFSATASMSSYVYAQVEVSYMRRRGVSGVSP